MKSEAGTVSVDYVTSDHLGSASVVTNAAGTVTERDSYDPWGLRRNANGNDASSCTAITSALTRGFTAQEHLDPACAINLNARLYDPTIGRLLSADSIVPNPMSGQSFNRYSYVENGPLSAIDPTGHGVNDTKSQPYGLFCDGADCIDDISINETVTVSANRDLNSISPFTSGDEFGASFSGFGLSDYWTFEGGTPNTGGGAGGAVAPTKNPIVPRDLVPVADNPGVFFSPSDLNAGEFVFDPETNSYEQYFENVTVTGPLNQFSSEALGNGGEDIIFGLLTLPFGGEGFEEGAISRGLSKLGGVFSKETNAVGGEVWTAVGDVSQNDFASIVNSGMYQGDVNILSGVHGAIDGTMIPDLSMYDADVGAFGNLEGVNVYNVPDMTSQQINGILNGPGTTIGGFCDSGACLGPFK